MRRTEIDVLQTQYFRLIACHCDSLHEEAVCNAARAFCYKVGCLSVQCVANLINQLHFFIGRPPSFTVMSDGLPEVRIALCDKGELRGLIVGQGRDQSQWR